MLTSLSIEGVWNEPFTHFLPVYIDERHGERAMKLVERTLSLLCTGRDWEFRPSHVLEILPKLMSTMVVDLNNGSVHVSIKGNLIN